MVELVSALLKDADKYGWTLRQLEKKVRRQFNSDKVREVTKLIFKDYVNKISNIKDNKNGKNKQKEKKHTNNLIKKQEEIKHYESITQI